jgi:endoglucanase
MKKVCARNLILAVLPFSVACGNAAPDDEATSQLTNDITINASATYVLTGVGSGKCVHVQGDSKTEGARLEIAACSNAPSQQFQAVPVGGGYFSLRNVNSGMCVDVSGASQANGAPVIQWACGGGTNQQWSFTDVAGGAERLTARHSGQVLDVTGAQTANGALLEQWPSNGGTNQQFRMNVLGASSSSSGASSSGASSSSSGGSSSSSGGGHPGTPVGVHGRLHIQGSKFVDANGHPVALHGMSMYDWSQQGQQFYNASAVSNLANEMKCAALRIPINPANYPGAVGRIKTVVNACIANGIYCILDWHPGGTSDVNQATSYFVQMAQAYHGVPNVMYEPWNEPPPTTSWSAIKAYHEHVLAAVRPIEPDAIFILGNRAWDQNPQEAAADPVNDPNVAYTVHFYANTHHLSSFQPGMDATLNKGFALFVTEYGGVDASGNGTFNVAETQKWWSYLDAHDIGNTNWAVETNTETSSVFVGNASATGPWSQNEITNSGKIVFPYIESKFAATVTP